MNSPLEELPFDFIDSTQLANFEASLPARYGVLFTKAERQAHARICSLRVPSGVSVGLFASEKEGQTAICLSAEDGPGVLSLASAALAILGFEVQEAVAFCRRMPDTDPDEILDVFWLKDPSGLIGGEQVAALSNLLSEYLAGRPPEVARRIGEEGSSPSGTAVRFVEDDRGALEILEVETSDRFGLLWDISRALSACELQILASEIHTQGNRVTDRFTVIEKSEIPISDERRLEIQTAVLSALEL